MKIEKNIAMAIEELNKIDALMYSFEKVYLECMDDSYDYNLMSRGTSQFYAIWESITKVIEILKSKL